MVEAQLIMLPPSERSHVRRRRRALVPSGNIVVLLPLVGSTPVTVTITSHGHPQRQQQPPPPPIAATVVQPPFTTQAASQSSPTDNKAVKALPQSPSIWPEYDFPPASSAASSSLSISQTPQDDSNDNSSNLMSNEAKTQFWRIGIWSYVTFLAVGLMAFIFFLLLPKGARKAYCRSNRRRYSRRHRLFQQQQQEESDAEWRDSLYHDLIAHSSHRQQQQQQRQQQKSRDDPSSSTDGEEEEDEFWLTQEQEHRKCDSIQHAAIQTPTPPRASSPIMADPSEPGVPQDGDESSSAWAVQDPNEDLSSSSVSSRPRTRPLEATNQKPCMRPMSMARTDQSMMLHQTPSPPQKPSLPIQTDVDQIVRDITVSAAFRVETTLPRSQSPSPYHPQIPHVPEEHVWKDALNRLRNHGIRLTAHGVQSNPKRIWIFYPNNDEKCLTWQTEFPKVETDNTNTIVLQRGPMHSIPLANILYIDVGKKTLALQKTLSIVPSSACFSLLTQQGSLDLQANSKLERDSIVSALSYLLDTVHITADWRMLYQDVASSIGLSSATGGPQTLSFIAASSIPSQFFPPGAMEI